MVVHVYPAPENAEMDEVSVRRASQGDAGAIADVFLASFAATYRFPLAHSDEDVRRWIPEILLPTEEVWVATDPGRLSSR